MIPVVRAKAHRVFMLFLCGRDSGRCTANHCGSAPARVVQGEDDVRKGRRSMSGIRVLFVHVIIPPCTKSAGCSTCSDVPRARRLLPCTNRTGHKCLTYSDAPRARRLPLVPRLGNDGEKWLCSMKTHARPFSSA